MTLTQGSTAVRKLAGAHPALEVVLSKQNLRPFVLVGGPMALHLGTSDPSGFFAGRSLAAHGVWLSEPDMAILADQDVAVAHCPQSNAKLASGVARPADMLAAGIRVGLGTDGPASNNDLDLWGLVGRLMHLAGQTNLASQCAARTLSSTIDPGGPDPIPCRCTPILT